MSSGATRHVLRNRLAKDANGPSPSKVAHVSARVRVPKVKEPSVVKMIAICLHEDFGYDGDSMSILKFEYNFVWRCSQEVRWRFAYQLHVAIILW
jgi:hypothetical protein